MKIILINLKTKNDHAFLNLGVLYIAAALRDAGHEIKLIDLVRYSESEINLLEIIKNFQPDLITFSGIITAYYQVERLSKILKNNFPEIPLLLGGSVGVSALKIIQAYTPIDFICAGEGEETVIKLLKEMRGNKNWELVPNIYYRQGKVFKASQQQSAYIENIDTISFPAYDLVDMEFYIQYATKIFRQEMADGKVSPRIITMIFTRGCPFSCTFCFRLIRKWRHHSIEYILRHLKYLKEQFHITGVSLYDELVFVDRTWFIALCEALSTSGLGLTFSCGGGKPSLVTEDVIIAMKKADFKRIGYGTESGSPKMLKLMKKEVTLEDNKRALELTLKHGMISRTNILFGHFGENKATVRETFKFLEYLYDLQEQYGMTEDQFQVWFATAYPGSPMYDQAIAEGLIKDERDYLLKVTSQDKYLVNLSEFRSAAYLRNFVYRGLHGLEIKKLLRSKRYGAIWGKLRSILFLYLAYYGSLGQFASFGDMIQSFKNRPGQ
ncbi:MAG: B12-binding domain-containing radical SAM protein [Candidatus Omnitrophica bacterium]|nr:B12-binding domain-containing radical SAM protein [Candidatus Omnitrophota bacterium]